FALIYNAFRAFIEHYGTLEILSDGAWAHVYYTDDQSLTWVELEELVLEANLTFTNWMLTTRSMSAYFNALETLNGFSFTGRKFNVTLNGVHRSRSTLPGLTAGVTTTGGQAS